MLGNDYGGLEGKERERILILQKGEMRDVNGGVLKCLGAFLSLYFK